MPEDRLAGSLTLHLLRLSVGTEDVDDLRRWQAARVFRRDGRDVAPGATRRMPRRRDALLDGGSIYWVIKGAIRVRQRLIDLAPDTDEAGRPCCRLLYDAALVETVATPQRAFQGWRYLTADRAPPDRDAGPVPDGDLPEPLRRELRALGIL